MEDSNKIDKIGSEVDKISNNPSEKAEKEEKSLFLTPESKENISKISSSAIRDIGTTLKYLICLIFILRTAHLVIPQEYFWIEKENLQIIDNLIILIFGGILSKFIPMKQQA